MRFTAVDNFVLYFCFGSVIAQTVVIPLIKFFTEYYK